MAEWKIEKMQKHFLLALECNFKTHKFLSKGVLKNFVYVATYHGIEVIFPFLE